jgi:hypothetical protein
MDDSLEWMIMEQDMMLSQVSIVPQELSLSSSDGGDLTPPPRAVRKHSGVFVDADGYNAPLSYDATSINHQTFEQDNTELGHVLQPYGECMADESQYHHMYFAVSSGSSPSYSDDDASQVMSEYFMSPATNVDPVEYTALQPQQQSPPQAVADWTEMSASLPESEAPVLQQILAEIRDAAAEIDQRSATTSPHGSSPSTTFDDEFEAALNDGEETDTQFDMEDIDLDTDVHLDSANKPKRKYSKRLGRPLTKEERFERKKAQNRAAAIRYRQKKIVCVSSTEVTLAQLTKRNGALRSTIKTTQAEIDIMKRLLHDVRQSLVGN